MAHEHFLAHVEELFAPLGKVRIKRMFGGAGVYAHDRMFALLADETIFLKVDDALKAALAAEGSAPFMWTPGDGRAPIAMSYWRMPDTALDDPDKAAEWGRRALEAAESSRSSAPRKKRTSR